MATAIPVSMQVLEDEAGVLTIEDVTSSIYEDQFRDTGYGFTAGYTRTVHWFRFTLDSPVGSDQVPRQLFLEAYPSYLDDLQLFLPDPNQTGQFLMKRSGDTHPFSTRDIPGNKFVFVVDFPDDRPQTLYLRLATTSSSILVLQAWNPTDFQKAQATEYGLLGLYFGLMIALLLMNLFFSQWSLEASYRNFIAYLISVILLMVGMNGFVSQYFAPDSPNFANHWVSAFVFIALSFAARFHRSILEINRQQPLLNAYFLTLTWLPFLLAPAVVLGYFTESARILMLVSVFSPLLGTSRSIVLLRQGRVGGRFLVLANFASLVGYTFTLLALLGLTDGGTNQVYGIQVSSLVSLLAFNLVLMTRVRHVQKERDLAQLSARRDPLTSLGNRLELEEELARAIQRARRTGRSGCVLLLDLNGFKRLNDTYGHAVGDRVLREVAHRLCATVRESDTVIRLGGDEFVIIMENLSLDDTAPLVEKLDREISAPQPYGDLVLEVGASIGVARFPEDGVKSEDLLEHADQAMYAIKRTRSP